MKTTDADFPAALEKAAEGWVGTPFRTLHATKDIGVDCANAVYGCLGDAGLAMPDLGAPTFGKSADVPFQSVIEEFLTSLVEAGTLVVVDDLSAPKITAGDVLLYRINARTQHVTVALDAALQLHTWPGRLTAIVAIDARWRNRLITHYRLTNV
jgi:hypothetical protein